MGFKSTNFAKFVEIFKKSTTREPRMNDLTRAKERLLSGGYTCVLRKGEQMEDSTLRGVKPLAAWYAQGKRFSGFSAADKIVGKATAFLYLLLGVKAVYAGVISRCALELLRERGVVVEYATLVEHVVNRTKDGICPFEEAVLSLDDDQAAYRAIVTKMQELHITL